MREAVGTRIAPPPLISPLRPSQPLDLLALNSSHCSLRSTLSLSSLSLDRGDVFVGFGCVVSYWIWVLESGMIFFFFLRWVNFFVIFNFIIFFLVSI